MTLEVCYIIGMLLSINTGHHKGPISMRRKKAGDDWSVLRDKNPALWKKIHSTSGSDIIMQDVL